MTAWAVYFKNPQPYARMALLQTRLVEALSTGAIPETVLLTEHLPVVTIGNRGRRDNLLLSPAALRAQGIELAASTRGGDITYHAPGQLIIYPILRLGDREADAHGYLHNLEEIALRTAADCGVAAFRRPGLTGAWTVQGKLAAIGIRLKRWITSHGMSFNVAPDMRGFRTIVPCGLAGEPVTSLRELLGAGCPASTYVRRRLLQNFNTICRRPTRPYTSSAAPAALQALLTEAAPDIDQNVAPL